MIAANLTWNDLRRAVRDAIATLEDHDPNLPATHIVQMHLDMAINALDEVAALIKCREGAITR